MEIGSLKGKALPPPCLLPQNTAPPLRPRINFSQLSHADHTLTRIQTSGIIACLRANTAELAMEAARAALSGGITVVLKQLVNDYPTTVLGVGTVLNIEDARKAVGAGAKFLMSPAIVKDVIDMDGFQNGEVLYIPGAMTPTEILSAHDSGAKIVKVYPVSVLGGVQYISALKKPFPHISMVASQGITIDSVGEYIANGASSVVLSDAIFDKEAMAQNNFIVIRQLAHFATLQASQVLEML
uniref:KHG/KDPG aldolase n=1 Tax=Cannabis sativa TaxID=3483 RepID=A0A803P2G0_CANSA